MPALAPGGLGAGARQHAALRVSEGFNVQERAPSNPQEERCSRVGEVPVWDAGHVAFDGIRYRASKNVPWTPSSGILELSFLPLTNARDSKRSSDSGPSTPLVTNVWRSPPPGFAATTREVDQSRPHSISSAVPAAAHTRAVCRTRDRSVAASGRSLIWQGRVLWCMLQVMEMTAADRESVERLARSTSAPHRKVVQAKALLRLADGVSVRSTAKAIGSHPDTVTRWRDRFVLSGA